MECSNRVGTRWEVPRWWSPLGSDPQEISVARAEYESDKFSRSAVESVKSRLSWWRKRAREHTITVERLQFLGTLLKRAGYRSAGAYLSAVKNQHSVGSPLDRCTGFGDEGRQTGL